MIAEDNVPPAGTSKAVITTLVQSVKSEAVLTLSTVHVARLAVSTLVGLANAPEKTVARMVKARRDCIVDSLYYGRSNLREGSEEIE